MEQCVCPKLSAPFSAQQLEVTSVAAPSLVLIEHYTVY